VRLRRHGTYRLLVSECEIRLVNRVLKRGAPEVLSAPGAKQRDVLVSHAGQTGGFVELRLAVICVGKRREENRTMIGRGQVKGAHASGPATRRRRAMPLKRTLGGDSTVVGLVVFALSPVCVPGAGNARRSVSVDSRD
jgi:hypothetical protein